MMARKTKIALGVLLLAALAAGTAGALPAPGYYLYFYDAQGNEVGGRERTCSGAWYTWGTTGPYREQGYYPCN